MLVNQVAKAMVADRLRTPLGGPVETLEALKKALLVRSSGLVSCKKNSGLNPPCKTVSMSLLVWSCVLMPCNTQRDVWGCLCFTGSAVVSSPSLTHFGLLLTF